MHSHFLGQQVIARVAIRDLDNLPARAKLIDVFDQDYFHVQSSILYAARKRLRIHPAGFGMFAAALLLHDLGAFGTYGHSYFDLEFDTYVHFFFGMAGSFLIARASDRP